MKEASGYKNATKSYLEDLEAVDVEDADVQLLLVLLHGFVDTLSHTHTQIKSSIKIKEIKEESEACGRGGGLTSTRKSKRRAYRALDRASLEKKACSVFRVTAMDSDFPPHLLSIILLVSLLQRPSCEIPSRKDGKARTDGETRGHNQQHNTTRPLRCL